MTASHEGGGEQAPSAPEQASSTPEHAPSAPEQGISAAEQGISAADLDVEEVDALPFVEAISKVLLAAWPAPAVHYTVDFLKWQFTFPGPPARGALGRVKGEPAAFVGFAPRRLRRGREASPSYATAFLGVVPTLRGGGVANRVYGPMIGMVAASGLPCVGFVDVTTPAARRLLVKHTEAHGMTLTSLRLCRNWGFLERAGTPPALPHREAASPEEVLRVIDACASEDTLWTAPDREGLLHYAKDPRGRKFVVVEEGGSVVGAAMVMLSEVTSKEGVDRLVTVDAIWLPEPTAPRLRALFQASRAAFAGQASAPMVGAPNLGTIDDATAKSAGLRPTAAVYEPFVYQRGQSVFTSSSVTNQEMV